MLWQLILLWLLTPHRLVDHSVHCWLTARPLLMSICSQSMKIYSVFQQINFKTAQVCIVGISVYIIVMLCCCYVQVNVTCFVHKLQQLVSSRLLGGHLRITSVRSSVCLMPVPCTERADMPLC